MFPGPLLSTACCLVCSSCTVAVLPAHGSSWLSAARGGMTVVLDTVRHALRVGGKDETSGLSGVSARVGGVMVCISPCMLYAKPALQRREVACT